MFSVTKHAAEQGDVNAQYDLGCMYKDGRGVAQDKKLAVEWFRKAATQGHSRAQFSLAIRYDNGDGVAEDKKLAVEWFRKAAKQGDVDAQWHLGYMYQFARGVAVDIRSAIEWYKVAGEQGATTALLTLARIYERGEGVTQDIQSAVRYYRMAAEKGERESVGLLEKSTNPFYMLHYALLHSDRDRVISLIERNPSLVSEIIWDFERAEKKDELYQSIVALIYPMLLQETWSIDVMNQVRIAYIKLIYQHHIDTEDVGNYFQQLISMLDKINIFYLSNKQINAFMINIIDAWYFSSASSSMDSHVELTSIFANQLKKILLVAKAKDIKLDDAHLLRQCALILLKEYFGVEYEISFDAFTFSDLMLFVAKMDQDRTSTPESINQLLKIELIKPSRYISYEHLLNQLSDYFDEIKNDSQKYIKKYLDQSWKNLDKKDEKIAHDVILGLPKSVREEVEIAKRHSGRLFKIEFHADPIFQYLAAGEMHHLEAYITEQMRSLDKVAALAQ